MELTTSYLMDKFNEFNKLYFDNEIHPINYFRINKKKSAFGTMHYRDWHIELSIFYNRDEKDYLNTLIHEMCHAYAYQKYGCRGHLGEWKMVARMITSKTKGMYGNIQRCGGGNIKCEISDERKRIGNFLLFTDCYDKFAVAKFSDKSLIKKFERGGAIKKNTPYYVVESRINKLCKLAKRSASNYTSCRWSYVDMSLEDILKDPSTNIQKKVG